MEFITSNKGSRKLLHEGYAYTKKNANKSSIRWECSQRMGLSCKGALNSDLLVSTFMLHFNYHFVTKLSTVILSWHLITCIGELLC